MGKNTPDPPEAPDYAAANREGIYADIETLPTRRKIEAAARLGEKVTYRMPDTVDDDGNTVIGEERTADFTGFGDMQLTEQEMNSALEMIPTMSQAQLDNLTEFGPQFVAEQRDQLRQMAPEEFDLREEFATRLRGGEKTAEELTAGVSVPEYEEFAGQSLVTPEYMEAQAGQAPAVPMYEEVSGDMPIVPEYEEVGATPDLADVGLTADMRADVEASIADRLALGEGLSGDQIRAVEQDILRTAAKRGQVMGGGTALREILGKFRAGEELGRQRRGEATGWLASGQASADVRNRLAQGNFANTMQKIQQVNQARGAKFAGEQQNVANTMQRVQQINQARSAQFAGEQQNLSNEMQRIQQINQARGVGFAGDQQNLANEMQRVQQINQARSAAFAGQQQALGTQIGSRQQDISNIQSMLGLQTVAAQGGALSGLQQGAAPFAPPQMARGIGLDAGAGQAATQFAGNVFGTQGSMYQAQLAQPSTFSEITSGLGALGAGAGKGGLGNIFCHTARLVFGEDNPEWVKFYLWKEYGAPNWFRSLYNKYTERVASWLKDKPRLQSIVRRWMRGKING
tara:strand:- start:5023 stop:6741 length:1719 start_codon:yes stop_codon:yes gene_type:complete